MPKYQCYGKCGKCQFFFSNPDRTVITEVNGVKRKVKRYYAGCDDDRALEIKRRAAKLMEKR